METVFSNLNERTLAIYKMHGFYYNDTTYINVFRWIWNELHYHPSIDSFPGDAENRTYVILESSDKQVPKYKFFANSYDDAIIGVVNYIAENYNNYLK